jgi:eukaryotic-like serine/threonine-protein kinase
MLLRDVPSHRIDLERGARVGAYRVEEVRARLAHVVVHRARHVVTGRPVALQVLRPTADAVALRAIQRDLAALNRLRHAHVAEILESGELADGRPFLVVEWIEGRSLQTALDAHGPLSLDDALPIADELGSALSAAHALGVVHGELHARNVGLVVHGEHQAVKIVNFGMVRLSGTRLAPEQSRAGAAASGFDRRVDVFALGALLYQMVTGVRPAADPPPPSVSAEVPHAFDEVVLRCLRADPSRRWSSIDELMTALRAAASGSELVAELYVTAYLDPAVDRIDNAALDDAERALFVAQRWLERQRIALVLPGAGAVVATARIPRALEQQRAARAGWVKLANAVRERMDRRRTPHPAVRTKVQIRIDG